MNSRDPARILQLQSVLNLLIDQTQSLIQNHPLFDHYQAMLNQLQMPLPRQQPLQQQQPQP